MKKIFVLLTVVVPTIVLMLSIGVNFAQAVENTMDNHDMMMKQGDMMMDKGKKMMTDSKMLLEITRDPDMVHDMMTKQGDMMMDKGKKMKEDTMK